MEIEQTKPLTKQERRELRQQEKTEEQRQREKKRLYRRAAVWSLVALIAGGGAFGMVKLASQPPQDGGPAVTVDAVSSDDWIKGNREAKTVLIEYSDFQCPACAYYYPLLKKLAEEFGDNLAVVYRHFPLPNHQNAKPAAYAAEAAGRQGKFWEMHNMIFDNQNEWKDGWGAEEKFLNYAQTLNLNVEQFKTAFGLKEARTKVESAYQNGVRLGITYTPTFFLDGRKISNPRNYDEFRNIILAAINRPR